MMRFALAPKDLKAKQLAESIKMGNSHESVDDLDNDDDTPNESIHKDNEDQTENECDYQAITQSDLKRQIKKSVHEGIKHSRNQCHYQATTQNSLKTHKAICSRRYEIFL